MKGSSKSLKGDILIRAVAQVYRAASLTMSFFSCYSLCQALVLSA